MLKIYIPTLKRWNKQRTWDCLPPKWREEALIVCPTDEAQYHLQRGRRVLICDAKGIGPVRDAILDHAHGIYPHIVMLDDDLKLQRVRRDGKITDASPEEHDEAFAWMDNALKIYTHAAFAPRFLAYTQRTDINNGRMLYSLAYNVPTVKALGAEFCKGMDQPSTMEDFNMTLQLLTKGHPNVISAEWRLSNLTSNAPGGCSTWRTTDVQSRSAYRLEALFPKFVKTRQKKEWRGMDVGMVDVTVQWKKAAEYGTSRS